MNYPDRLAKGSKVFSNPIEDYFGFADTEFPVKPLNGIASILTAIAGTAKRQDVACHVTGIVDATIGNRYPVITFKPRILFAANSAPMIKPFFSVMPIIPVETYSKPCAQSATFSLVISIAISILRTLYFAVLCNALSAVRYKPARLMDTSMKVLIRSRFNNLALRTSLEPILYRLDYFTRFCRMPKNARAAANRQTVRTMFISVKILSSTREALTAFGASFARYGMINVRHGNSTPVSQSPAVLEHSAGALLSTDYTTGSAA